MSWAPKHSKSAGHDFLLTVGLKSLWSHPVIWYYLLSWLLIYHRKGYCNEFIMILLTSSFHLVEHVFLTVARIWPFTLVPTHITHFSITISILIPFISNIYKITIFASFLPRPDVCARRNPTSITTFESIRYIIGNIFVVDVIAFVAIRQPPMLETCYNGVIMN